MTKPERSGVPGARRPPGLAQQLVLVAGCVRGVLQGRSLTDELAPLPPDLRPGVQALAFHVLRRLGRARALLRRLVARRPEPAAEALLLSAIGLMCDALAGRPPVDGVRYEPHTLVHQAVEAAKGQATTRRQAAFVNACLRRLLRESAVLQQGLEEDPEACWNHPRWWIERLREDHPAHWQAILAADEQPGPMCLRVNRRRIAREAYRQRLAEVGLAAEPVGTDGLVLERAVPVTQLPGFEAGWCSVQDAAAQLAAPLLLADWPAHHPDGRRWRVLDACAAPGGKTAHLLEWADLELLALDVDAQRCERVRANLRRLGLQATVCVADAGDLGSWWDGRPFDAVLLDAPCTASGIVRRHPDVRWLRRPSDVMRLAATQARLLEALWTVLAPGGRLLYATCSVFRAEGQVQIDAFAARHSDARRDPRLGHLLPGNAGQVADFADNVPGGYDGFFYARLDRMVAQG